MKYDIKIVPVCINYDRVFDVNFFSEETPNGEFKPDITLMNVVGKIMSMNKGKLGKVFVKYDDPIDLNEYMNSYRNENIKHRMEIQLHSERVSISE